MTTIFEIAERMKGQDPRATASPIYCVQALGRVIGVEQTCTDNVLYMTDEGEIFFDEEEVEEHVKEYGGDYEEQGYTEFWETLEQFFSLEGAEKYIEENKHNHEDLRVYVISASRNDEMKCVIQFLEELAEGKWVVQPN